MSDALEELMKQKRPSVKARSEQLDTNDKSHLDTDASKHIDSNKLNHEVVRNSILIEKVVNQALSEYCDREKLIKAVWIEAAFLYLEEHPEAKQAVLKLARSRHEERKEFAKDRQAMTFSKRLSKST